MMLSAKPIEGFVDRNPTIEMLVSLLLLTGFKLIVEGFDAHLPGGYICFAMFLPVCVELLDMRPRKRRRLADQLSESGGALGSGRYRLVAPDQA